MPTFLATAIGFIAAAIIANGSIAGAVGSPGLMLAAALFSAVAVAVLAAAEGLVSAYCTCLQAAGGDAAECAGGSCDSLRAAIAGLITVVGVQAAAAFAAAGVAAIPFVGAAPMTYIMVMLGLQFLLILTVIALLIRLRRCVAAVLPPVPPGPP